MNAMSAGVFFKPLTRPSAEGIDPDIGLIMTEPWGTALNRWQAKYTPCITCVSIYKSRNIKKANLHEMVGMLRKLVSSDTFDASSRIRRVGPATSYLCF